MHYRFHPQSRNALQVRFFRLFWESFPDHHPTERDLSLHPFPPQSQRLVYSYTVLTIMLITILVIYLSTYLLSVSPPLLLPVDCELRKNLELDRPEFKFQLINLQAS